MIRFLSSAPGLAALIGLAVFFVLRLALFATVPGGELSAAYLPEILVRGLYFDLATLCFLLVPVLLYEAFLPARWRSAKWHRRLRFSVFATLTSALLFVAISEATFWLEFAARFNFIALDYLMYTQEVVGNIWQSYPVPSILAAMVFAAMVLTWLGRGALLAVDRQAPSRTGRLAFLTAAAVLPALSYQWANIDQMENTDNRYANELSGNGLFTLAAAMRRNELDYDRFYRTIPQPQADRILESLGVERLPLSAMPAGASMDDPATDEVPFVRRPKNIVLITVESLSAEFLGAYGSTAGLTPRLDALARDGLLFERVFATGTRTVRGLEALSLGIPPVPGQAIVRRPFNDSLSTLGEILKPQGVTPLFVYGGYGYFDNMNAYFGSNGYEVLDRLSIPKDQVVFENAWGVADEVLFAQSIAVLNERARQDKPFFAHLMTTSNHRPYSYPDGRIDIASPGGRAGAIKYTDHAIGKFIDDARRQPWFDDTLFVVVADHCASASGKRTLSVEGYHIPLIFYAPSLLKPGRFKPMVSQLDLAPTLVEVLGKRGDDHFFGRSFFEEGPMLERAFISNYQALGYLRRDTLTVLLPRQHVESYSVDPVTLATVPTQVDPELLNEAIAYYQTAARAFKQGALKMAR